MLEVNEHLLFNWKPTSPPKPFTKINEILYKNTKTFPDAIKTM